MSKDKKSAELKALTDEVRGIFSLPSTESVIQDYVCKISSHHTRGTMFVTQNYILWKSKLTSSHESIPFVKVKSIVLEDHVTKSMVVQTAEMAYSFGSFMNFSKAWALVNHLWKNPVTYTKPPPADSTPKAAVSTSASWDDGTAAKTPATSSTTTTSSASWDDGEDQLLDVQVDTSASKAALKTALECRDISAKTMAELSAQGEVLDQIEYNVESIHNDLDHGQRHIRGTESVVGHIKNKLSHDPKDLGPMVKKDHTIVAKARDVTEEIDLLQKMHKGDFVPSTLRLTPDGFSIIVGTVTATTPSSPSATTKPTPTAATSAPPSKVFPYDSLQQIVVCSRPQHMEIKFREGKGEPVKICTAYMQWILSEFHVRAPTASVDFQPNAPRFDYKDQFVLAACKLQRKKKPGSDTPIGTAPKGVDPLIAKAPSHLQAQLLEQDRDLDQINDVLGDLHGMASGMTVAIDDQITQIERVTKRAESANERITNQDGRIDKMLNKS
ncbi:delta-aminolevulinate dehydratase [Pelomyxa schiedti]|nr:delta-aminolevulinate dehydratase [Pelomyxa schiedti]